MAQQIINNLEGGLSVRTALNAMFAELYAAIVAPLKLIGINSNAQQVIPANTWLESIFITATVGTPTIRIGTAPNGTDICPDIMPGNWQEITVQQYFPANTTLYITLSGGTVSIRFNVLNNIY